MKRWRLAHTHCSCSATPVPSSAPTARLQDPGKVLKRTRLPRSAQAAPQRRVLCPDPVAPVAKRQRMDDNAEVGGWVGGGEVVKMRGWG
jgi:hypothetical protein